jgi:hypothetical protein
MMYRTTALDVFRKLREHGYETEHALSTVCEIAGLDYDEHEDEICELKSYLVLNDVHPPYYE